jgi:predicted lipase
MNKIKFAFQHANLAGKMPKSSLGIHLVENAQKFIVMDNGTDYGYYAEYEDYSVISFAGTKGLEKPNGTRTWISNFDAYPLRELPEDITEDRKRIIISTFGLVKDGPWGKGTIHDGFYTGWLFFKNLVNACINKNKAIFCTGHSRGGALAVLCGRHIAKNIHDIPAPISVLSFGNPSVGIKEFRDEYEHLGLFTTRITHGVDIVPTMPPYALGFRHVGNHVYLDCPAWQKVFPMKLIYRFVHHTYENYQRRINVIKD